MKKHTTYDFSVSMHRVKKIPIRINLLLLVTRNAKISWFSHKLLAPLKCSVTRNGIKATQCQHSISEPSKGRGPSSHVANPSPRITLNGI